MLNEHSIDNGNRYKMNNVFCTQKQKQHLWFHYFLVANFNDHFLGQLLYQQKYQLVYLQINMIHQLQNQQNKLHKWIAQKKEIWRKFDLLTLHVKLAKMENLRGSHDICEVIRHLIKEKEEEETEKKARARGKISRQFSLKTDGQLLDSREEMLLRPNESKYFDLLQSHLAQRRLRAELQTRKQELASRKQTALANVASMIILIILGIATIIVYLNQIWSEEQNKAIDIIATIFLGIMAIGGIVGICFLWKIKNLSYFIETTSKETRNQGNEEGVKSSSSNQGSSQNVNKKNLSI